MHFISERLGEKPRLFHVVIHDSVMGNQIARLSGVAEPLQDSVFAWRILILIDFLLIAPT